GRTLHDQLELLFRRHGLYLSTGVSIKLEGSSGAERREVLMQQVRSAPPGELAGLRVNAALDLKTGSVSGTPSASFKLPPSDALLWELDGGHRVCVRPSGTEPKIKVYFDVREPMRAEDTTEAAQARARLTAEALAKDMRARLA